MAKKTKDSNLSLEERLEQALIPNWDEPYKLPDNWCWLKLLSAFENCTDSKKKIQQKDYLESGLWSVVDQGQSLVGGYTNDETMLYNGNLPVIIFGDHTRCVKYIDFNFAQGADGVKVLRPKPFYLPKFFFYALQNVDIPNLGYRRHFPLFDKFSIPLAPLEEQQRIVEHVESLFAKLDEAKEKAQEVVDGFETRKAAILHKAFSGELTAKWREENDVSIDKWERLTLDDVADYKKGPFGSSITKAMFVPKGENTYKVYEQGNAIRKTLDYGSYYISQKKYEELKGFAINPGDIIVSCAGTIGEIYKLPNNCEAGVINQALMRVRVYNNINEMYFIHYFTGVLKGDVIDEANGTAIKNIPPFKVLKAMNILLPSLFEQNEIVEILERMLSKEQVAKETAETVIEQIDTMKKAILARAFRGELGTNNPSEESAVELLKKVLSGGEN